MDHPSQLLSRARRQRARGTPFDGGRAPVTPAPQTSQATQVPPVAPAPAPQATQAAPAPQASPASQPTQAPQARPAPRGHALYSQVMRSHDRMGTRHL